MRLHLPNGLLKRAAADLSDLTASGRVGDPYWSADEVDVLIIPLDPEPSADEQAAIRRRLVTTDDGDEQRLADLRAARVAASTTFERVWLDTELAKYGEG